MAKRRTYNDVKNIFTDKECSLLTPQDEFDNMKEISRSKFCFIAKCGHYNEVFLTNFISKGSGIYCKECMKIILSDKLRMFAKNVNVKLQEYDAYMYLHTILNDDFVIRRTNEGCLSDFVVKPKYMDSQDKWLLIQMKSTKTVCNSLYTFKLNKTYYDCIIICVCMDTKDMWLFDWNDFDGKCAINIGVTTRSKVYNNKITSTAILCDIINNKYAKYPKFRLSYAMTPQSYYQRREHIFRTHREQNFNYIPYEYPCIEGMNYDFKVNGFKIQEKVAGRCKNRKCGYAAMLYTNNGSVNKKRLFKPYCVGANDFYWVWLEDNFHNFYIFSEDILIEKGIVTNELISKPILYLSDNWTRDYMYNIIDDKEKIIGLFPIG